MPNIETLRRNLEARGFQTSYYETCQDACDDLVRRLAGREIGFGGSITLRELGLFDRLKETSTCFWHW